MNIRDNNQIIKFVAAAKFFCNLLKSKNKDAEIKINQILSAIADLYSLAHHLPRINLETDIVNFELYEVDKEEWETIFHSIALLFGEQRYYWEYYDPSESIDSNIEPVIGDLADDIADIYRDIMPGLRAWNIVNDKLLPEIIFNWKEPLFGSHWGDHALSAMRVLHQIVFSKGLKNATKKSITRR
ncbi:DUF5063 domain-containing protein [Desulfobacterales bacterium HSG17]|nr:DUF5063 domain-containing protein [Desulfobacterales bacterium HSG17]